MAVKNIITFFLLLSLISTIVIGANTTTSVPTIPSEKPMTAEFDIMQQKTVAQLSAKMDAQANKIASDLERNVQKAKEDMKVEIINEVKSQLKGVVIGLAGIIVVILAVFRIIELRLNHTARIKKYEAELSKEKEKYVKEREALVKNRIELIAYRAELERLGKVMESYGVNPQLAMPKIDMPKEKPNSFLKIVTIVLIFGCACALVYFLIQSGIFAPDTPLNPNLSQRIFTNITRSMNGTH